MAMGFKTAFVYSTDENYVKLTAVSIHSLLTHNPGVPIVILTNGISESSMAFLRKLVADRGGSLELIDVKEKLGKIKSLGANEYVSYSTYARFFICELLGDSYDRAIYIDCDTLIADSLDGLVNLDLHGKTFAIGYDCIHSAYKRIIGLPENKPYYNAGILLIDIRKWGEQKCAERIFDYMRNVKATSILGDQDHFSITLADDAIPFPPQYDFLPHYQMFRRAKDAQFVMDTPACCWYGDDEFAAAQERPVIYHFLGHTLGRPWFKESLNPLRPLYVQTAAEAGVPEVAEQSRPIDFCYRIQWLCWKLLPRPLFLYACRAMYRYFFWSRYGV